MMTLRHYTITTATPRSRRHIDMARKVRKSARRVYMMLLKVRVKHDVTGLLCAE